MDLKVVDSLGFVASAVSLLCLSPLEATNTVLPLPWILTAGVFLHLYAARLAYAAGTLAKAYVMIVLAAFWGVWATFLLSRELFAFQDLYLSLLTSLFLPPNLCNDSIGFGFVRLVFGVKTQQRPGSKIRPLVKISV